MNIERLCVQDFSNDHPRVQLFSKKLNLKPEPIDDATSLYREIKNHDDPCYFGKQVLLLSRNKGTFLRTCPGTKDYLCCGYRTLYIGAYCTMDCSYCILQSYFHPPLLRFFLNHEDLWAELDEAFRQSETLRIGTGEFTDSLIWEGVSNLNRNLITRFGEQATAVLELKSKTTNISRFKDLAHNGKTILAWSLNTPRVIASEERGTATIEARLRAASQCAAWGYPLAFHFDPMVIYPGCEKEYREVVERLFASVSPDRIVWISLGTMRFMPLLRSLIEQRFNHSTIIYGEFVPGLDGKMRYFKPLRTKLYAQMAHWIRKIAPAATIYLCMEDDQVWRQSLGYSPQTRGGLSAILDQSARQHCDLR